MQIVIDIDDMAYKFVQNTSFVEDESTMFKQTNADRKKTLLLFGILDAIKNGTPLPKGHGRLIDADKCIRQAWNDFYKHEEEWEKKDPDYVGVKRLHDQNGFECCLKTICESPTVIESEDKLDGDPIDIDKAVEHYEGTLETLKGIDLEVDG